MKSATVRAIPRDVAQRLCTEIRCENGVKLFSQCWGCVRFSKGDPAKICFNNKEGNRGCGLINKRFDKQQQH